MAHLGPSNQHLLCPVFKGWMDGTGWGGWNDAMIRWGSMDGS